jgi:2-dehydro-3-deoxyglucarate aldolase
MSNSKFEQRSFREILRKRELTIGSWLQLGSTDVAEIMANAGFEFLVVDMEHSATGINEAHNLIRVVELSGARPLVRVPENNLTIIKQVMDMGAHGVIVPMISTVSQAQAAVSAAKYPPEGTRGVGLWRAQGYGKDFERYGEWLKSDSVVIVQIEHVDGVNNLEAISQVAGVDAFMIGPYDLSASLGISGQFDHPLFLETMKQVGDIARRGRIAAGYHIVRPSWAAAKEKIAAGFTFLVYGVDFIYLGDTCRGAMSDLRTQLKSAGTGKTSPAS